MKPSISYEVLRLALIQAVKVKKPKACNCKVCGTPFRHLHMINIPGGDRIFICENCVEEFNDFFKNREHKESEELFSNTVDMLMGQRQLPNYIEEDLNDFGNYYDAWLYNMDRKI